MMPRLRLVTRLLPVVVFGLAAVDWQAGDRGSWTPALAGQPTSAASETPLPTAETIPTAETTPTAGPTATTPLSPTDAPTATPMSTDAPGTAMPGPTESPTATATASEPTATLAPTAIVTSPTPAATLVPTPLPTATEAAASSGPIFVPYAVRNWTLSVPKPRTWGLQFAWDEVPDQHVEGLRELGRAQKAGLAAIRTNVRWSVVEPVNTTEDQFNWDDSDKRIRDYSAANLDIIVTIVDYPKWAMVYACGFAFKPGMDAEWSSFVGAVARRYRQAPSRVIAFELGNEVDGRTTVLEADRRRPEGWGKNEPTVPVGGCWGDRAGPYLGFLKAGYQAVKAADPEALVTFGNLAYAWPHDGVNDFHVDFFDKLLDAGGGPYFDYLGFHHFPDLSGQPTGPEKMRALLDSMKRRGIAGRPIWLTETYGLTWPNDEESLFRQVERLTKDYVELLAFPDLARVYWFSFMDSPPTFKSPGLPDRGLVTIKHEAKPALQVLPFAVRYTNGRPEDASTPTLAVYRFWPPRAAEHYVVAWSKDGQSHRLTEAVRIGQTVKQTRFPKSELMAGRCCRESSQVAGESSLTIDVGSEPVFIEVK